MSKIVTDGSEPLAADVRGASKKEIKKKIKAEVLRIAAVMFGCSYDDLKQRHRETRIRRAIGASFLVASVGAGFGTYASIQAAQIKSQSELIQNQYEEIEKQYKQIESQNNQNLIKATELAMAKIEDYLREGNIQQARQLVLDTIPDFSDTIPDEAKNNIRYSFGEAYGIYDNGGQFKAVENIVASQNIYSVTASPNKKYLALVDVEDGVTFIDFETRQEIGYFKTSNTMVRSDELVVMSDDCAFFSNDEGVICFDLKLGTIRYKVPSQYVKIISYLASSDQLFVVDDSKEMIIDNRSGNVINAKDSTISEGVSVNSYVIDEEESMGYYCYENDYKTVLIKMDLNSLESSQIEYLNIYIGKLFFNKKDKSLVASSQEFIGDEIYNKTLKINTQSLDYKVIYKSSGLAYKIYGIDDGRFLIDTTDEIVLFDAETYGVLGKFEISKQIQNVSVDENGLLILYFYNGMVQFQYDDRFEFYESEINSLPNGNYIFVENVGNYVVTIEDSNTTSVVLYSRKKNEIAKETSTSNYYYIDENFDRILGTDDFTSKDGKITLSVNKDGVHINKEGMEYLFETKEGSVAGIGASDDSSLVFVIYKSGRASIVETEHYTVVRDIEDMGNSIIYENLGDDYYALVDETKAIIITKNGNFKVAKVYGFKGYDSQKNVFLLANDVSDDYLYEIPFYTYNEIIEKLAGEY